MRLSFLFLPILLLLGLSSCSKVSYSSYSKDRKERVRGTSRSSTYAYQSRTKTRRSASHYPAARRPDVKRPTKIDHISLRKSIISDAQAHLGTRYVYGGKRPGGFDCSGFTAYVLSGNGVTLRGSSRDQAEVGDSKPISALAPGDLAFFGSKGKVSHVGIVKENHGDQLIVIHATSSAGVSEDDVLGSDYWRSRLLFGRDVIR